MLTGNYSQEGGYLLQYICVVCTCINDFLNTIIIFLDKGLEIQWGWEKFHHKPYLVAGESST